MYQLKIQPRKGWKEKVEDLGLVYNTTPTGTPYWNESLVYSFSMSEIDRLEDATNELHGMCLDAVQHVIDENLFHQFSIPEKVIPLIKWSFENEKDKSLYGRFDLAYDGERIKMLEYNADTPTSLLEASVVQWLWKEEVFPEADQFNSIHERLVDKWKELCLGNMFFAHAKESSHEDFMNVNYLRDTAEEASMSTDGILMEQIGWNRERNCFADMDENEINNIFKLYPWEWMMDEAFCDEMIATYKDMRWVEPIWKMVLSNKAILVILWEIFPEHPLLLKASFEPLEFGTYVKKPKLSREGANISILRPGEEVVKTGGSYDEGDSIYQRFFFNDSDLTNPFIQTPILGSWVIAGESAGMGIRQCNGYITDNTSQFIPHIII